MNKRRTILVQHYDSPCGSLVLAAMDDGLYLCDWYGRPSAERNQHRLRKHLEAVFVSGTSAMLEQTKKQLDEYFSGDRHTFDIPLHPVGTEFQRRVWKALCDIPYGETRSYKDVAQAVGCPKGVRAVAQAIGSNGISIFIPCHRVVGSDHSLTGFAGGLEAKSKLLATEQKHFSINK